VGGVSQQAREVRIAPDQSKLLPSLLRFATMHDPLLFRRRLALHLLGLVGAASLAACSGSSATGGPASASSTGTPGASASGTGGAHPGTGGATSKATASSTSGMGGGGLIFDAGFGTGGAGGGSDIPTAPECFDWPPEAGYPIVMYPDAGDEDAGQWLPFDAGPPTDECPTNTKLVVYEIAGNTCMAGGWDPYAIASGPTRNATNQCCYVVDLQLCVGGGRPYLVDDTACLSALARGVDGWAEGAAPCCDGLSAGERTALAEAWAADALREHASVASFSRFSLDLLAAGAPAHLVAQAHQAALDEIRHAELCFALAAGYAGEALGPGPFPVGAEVRVAGDLAALVASAVKEGCVGETVAAVMAAEQLARAKDPAVRAALARIAVDEARHAELAWRTVAWAVREGGAEVRAAAARAFAEALAGGAGAEGTDGVAALADHGRLDASTAARIAASALEEVVVPAARALLGETRRAARATLQA